MRQRSPREAKYRPEYPGRFDDLSDAESHCRDFFNWYNNEHHHSRLGLMTPHDIHQALEKRACGYRNRARFCNAILFHCGSLDLYPSSLATNPNS
ncbi:transposase [Pseudenhygromyxa sp. WMMC2535]|nr:transposase [Pseudenhygromyxa sp. WMMC2535]